MVIKLLLLRQILESVLESEIPLDLVWPHFLFNHPALINNWMMAREEAIARVRAVNKASAAEVTEFVTSFERAKFNFSNWNTVHKIQLEKLASLGDDLEKMSVYISTEKPQL